METIQAELATRLEEINEQKQFAQDLVEALKDLDDFEALNLAVMLDALAGVPLKLMSSEEDVDNIAALSFIHEITN
jgi:hypothetical protein